MRCQILHESRYRLRVRLTGIKGNPEAADLLYEYLLKNKNISSVSVSERTGDAVIVHNGSRSEAVSALAAFDPSENRDLISGPSSRRLSREYEEKLVVHIVKRGLGRLFLPVSVRNVIRTVRAVKFVKPGLLAILKGKLEVSVLDALTIGISILRSDFDTAADIMFLLGISEILEEWTHKKSVDDLARSMSLNIDRVWIRTPEGTEVSVRVSEVKEGDLVVIRQSEVIPLDGILTEGELSVNQAAMTGESMPVHKGPDSYVYAGTVVEDGQGVFRVVKAAGSSRYDAIVRMIEDTEKLSSDSENRAAELADRLVPWCLGATALTYLFTRNTTRALSVLMVDFSCALKLTIPISVLSAMRQVTDDAIRVKGGRYLEIAANVDTIVFDKTGTLTCSVPRVVKVIAFGDNDPDEMLRLAACLEEHYPHSVATAVVKAAEEKNLEHEERHTKVEYVVAHGIASSIDGQRCLIGSWHFVFEDEGCHIPEGEEEKFSSVPDEYSHLYLAIGGVLSAVVCIEDPVREEARSVIERLRALGITKIAMMTGDSQRTAAAVAKRLGIDEFKAEVLPADKADFIKSEHEKGRTVMMIGDGINDAPAMALADASAAISDGAAIAREIADITVMSDSLEGLVALRQVSDALMDRIRFNYGTIIGFNSTLIVLGMLGILTPNLAAYAHNFSTMALSMHSLTRLKTENLRS